MLSLAVLALVLTWCQNEQSARWWQRVRQRTDFVTRRLVPKRASLGDHPVDLDALPRPNQARRVGALVVILGIYGVVVFVHQLSPYIVALQITALAIFGRVRPRWLAPVMWLMPIGYLLPRFTFINDNYGVLNSLGSFFTNAQVYSTEVHRPYDLGVRWVSHISVAITLLVWVLAAIGLVRRVRAGRPTMVLAILAFSPVVTLFMTSYGGEATYRVYFFSLPWVALLAASAIAPAVSGRPLRSIFPLGAVLVVLIALLLPAYFGDDEIYATSSSEITAANYFYDHAPPGSALIPTAGGFPLNISGRYNEYLFYKNKYAPDLLYYPPFGSYQLLGSQSLPALRNVAQAFIEGGSTNVYIAFTTSGFAAAQAYDLTLPGALQDLEAAMTHSPEWSVFFKNATTGIFLFHPENKGR